MKIFLYTLGIFKRIEIFLIFRIFYCWQCNHKYKKKGYQATMRLTKGTFHIAFVEAFNRFIENREWFIEDYNTILETLTNTLALDEVADEKLERNYNRESIAKVLEYLKEQDCLLTEFDEEI